MAYRAEIQIGVVGIGQLGALQKSLNQVATTVDIINKKRVDAGFNVQNINTYNAALQKAWQNINKAAMGSQEELQAVKDLVTAKNNQIAAQQRLNFLIAKEEASYKRIVATADAGFGEQGPKLPAKAKGAAKPQGLGFRAQPGGENLALGAGFPLLFGGGAGQVAGGLLGSFFGEGFGGQILGSAIGQQLEDAQRRIAEIGNALNTLNMDALKESAILVNSQLENQVRLLQEAGRADEARAAIADQVTLQTGLLPEAVGDITNNVNLLGNTWNEFLGAVSGTLSIIGAPFVTALTVIGQGLAKALQGVNVIASGVGLILKRFVELVSKIPFLQPILKFIEERTKAIQESEESRVATLQKLTDGQLKELLNTQKLLQLESQRTLGRTTAEKQINIEVDKQLAKERIRTEYAEKAKQIRQEYGSVTTEAGKRELELALQINGALEAQALQQQRIKDRLAEQALQIEANTEKYDQAATAIQNQIAALDRGNQVTQSRYSAEAAINDLYGAQLQRQYELATTAQQRFTLAIKMFEQQTYAAQIEYQQAVNANNLLIQKAQLESNLVQLKYKQLEAEKAIAIAAAQSRGNTPEQINAIAAAYDKGLGIQKEAVQISYDQVQATVEIATNQNTVADAVYKTKIVQAESALAQKLVSSEIGLSQGAANRLAGSLAVGVFKATEMSGAMGIVARQAAYAAQQIQNAINLQNMLRGGGDQNAGARQAFATGGFVTGATNAVVGEGGPEYIIPAAKMDEAMSRYAQGQRGSSVIPSSINPQVNVTTGPVMNMNGSNYVSQQDFMAGLQIASRRGAQMALSAMRGNGGIRRSVGAR